MSEPRRRGRPRQTHCKHGHALVEPNLLYWNQGPYRVRGCKKCYNTRAKAKREADRAGTKNDLTAVAQTDSLEK